MDLQNGKKPLLVFFGHHKGATKWINAISEMVCYELGLKHAIVSSAKVFDYDLRGFVESEKIDFLAYDNADYQYVKDLDNFIGFHVVRDPRDVVVSSYFSSLYSHSTSNWPELVEYRKKLEGLSTEEGLMEELEARRPEFLSMNEWNYNQSTVLELKMEEMTASPYNSFAEIFAFLGLVDVDEDSPIKRLKHALAYFGRPVRRRTHKRNLNPFISDKIHLERLLGIVLENDFKKMAGGRKAGDEDIKSHYRKGVAGDWVNYFKEEHIKFFKENYNEVLMKLSYESEAEWNNDKK